MLVLTQARNRVPLALVVTMVAAMATVTSGGCAHPPWNPYKNWQVARTKHITAYTNTHVRYAITLETLDLAYSALHASLFKSRPIAPVEVLLLEQPEFQRTLGQFRSSVSIAKLPGKGVLARRGLIVMIGLDISMGGAAHRIAHLFLHANAPHAPLWIHEGLASYVESVEYRDNGKTDDKAFACLGTLGPKQPEIPLAELFSWSWKGIDESKKSSWYRYTASSLVDYFLFGEEGKLRTKFGDLLDELAQGGDTGAALAKVYPGLTVAGLEQKAREHRSRSETVPRGLCPMPFLIPQDKAGDTNSARVEPAEQSDIEELMLRLQLLPRRQGYVDWYPPDSLGLKYGEMGGWGQQPAGAQ
jgi:hypothetical protein